MANVTAISTVRETAKWLIAAFAAVAAALISGIQISHIGDLEFGGRLMVAVIAFAIGLICIGGSIWSVIPVLSPFAISLKELATENKYRSLRNRIEEERKDILVDFEDIGKLNSCLEETRNKLLTTRKECQVAYANAKNEYERANNIKNIIMDFAAFEIVTDKFHYAVSNISVGVAGTALSILAFAYAANPSHIPAGWTQFGAVPVYNIIVDKEEQASVSEIFGDRCVSNYIQIIKIGEIGDAWDVVSIPRAGCPSKRITLDRKLGRLVPLN